MSQKENGKLRLHRIDEYRGFVLINMIIYHAIWDLVYIFGVKWQWYKSDIGFYWQQWICWSFILVSGFCWQMGSHPLKRGLMVYGGGVIIFNSNNDCHAKFSCACLLLYLLHDCWCCCSPKL